MWPSVRDGAVVEAVPCRADQLRAGELGVYLRERSIVVHRLTTGGRFRGDALDVDDELVPAEMILGRARVVTQRPRTIRLPSWRETKLLVRALVSRLRS